MKRDHAITYMSDESLTALWKTFGKKWDDPEWKERICWAMLLLSTGMRIEEATQISVRNCSIYPNAIKVIGKGNKWRWVEIDTHARPFISQYVEDQARSEKGYLFPGQRKPKGLQEVRTCVSIRKARDWWGEVLELAGVEYISPHGARRTFTTWNAERLSLQDMKDQLGHVELRTTEKHYRGSIPGRRFEKPKPQWIETAERVATEFEKRQEKNKRHLRVVGE
jgi:integrase